MADQSVVPAERVEILGVGVHLLTMERAVETIAAWIERRERNYVCVTGVHGVMESWDDPELRRIHNRAGLVTPDGMPLVWLARRRGRQVERVYGPDLMEHVFERSRTTGWRHYLYGSSPATLVALDRNLRRRFPGARIVGCLSPPYRPLTADEERAVRGRIAASRADIVWVGLSTPKQERWMAAHVGCLGPPVLVGVGAAFDIHAGRVRRAPGWMQRYGLEWLFRMGLEPHRLASRYLRNNPRFLWLIATGGAARCQPLMSDEHGGD
jgi:N-acetylglucosaminyldiphosphoundecaprenol N-acetyl-beta-D-mannosaminyltransferase